MKRWLASIIICALTVLTVGPMTVECAELTEATEADLPTPCATVTAGVVMAESTAEKTRDNHRPSNPFAQSYRLRTGACDMAGRCVALLILLCVLRE